MMIDRQDVVPMMYCQWCGSEVYDGEATFELDCGKTVCLECFKEYVNDMATDNPHELANRMGITSNGFKFDWGGYE